MFRTKLTKREEALRDLDEPKYLHQVTLCFGGLKFAKIQLELNRPLDRSEFKDLENYLLEQYRPIFKGLIKVIVHN
jgi:hypothetical protein